MITYKTKILPFQVVNWMKVLTDNQKICSFVLKIQIRLCMDIINGGINHYLKSTRDSIIFTIIFSRHRSNGLSMQKFCQENACETIEFGCIIVGESLIAWMFPNFQQINSRFFHIANNIWSINMSMGMLQFWSDFVILKSVFFLIFEYV